MHVEDFKPGRELDFLIQERIFKNENIHAPHYSTDIKSAWSILEYLELKGLEDQNISKELNSCEVFISDFHEKAARAQSKTVPHAICLAALKVMETF